MASKSGVALASPAGCDVGCVQVLFVAGVVFLLGGPAMTHITCTHSTVDSRL